MTNLHVDERRLLDVWRDVSTLSRPGKEVALLAAVTDRTPEYCARLPIGERDRRLMVLHERTFGGRYDCETRCSSCGMRMAFSFVASDLGLEPTVVDADSLTLTEGRIVVKLHLPTSADLAASLGHANPVGALFARCVKVQSSPAHRLKQMDLPVSLRQSAIERLAALDLHADLMFELECPQCEHDNKVMFDPVVALFSQAAQFLPVVPPPPPPRTERGAPKATGEVPSGPGASIGDFLGRLVRRHVVDAVVHPLRGEGFG